MAVIVVGGHSRNIGKTSVAAGIVAGFPELDWTAIKITQYGHGICAANGGCCACATPDHAAAVTEERDRSGKTDTSRLLTAGAKHVYWVRTRQGYLAEAIKRVRQVMAQSENVIIESNSIMGFVRPDLYLVVVDPAKADFKQSVRLFVDRADALLVPEECMEEKAWAGDWPGIMKNMPVLPLRLPGYITPEVLEYVRGAVSLVRG